MIEVVSSLVAEGRGENAGPQDAGDAVGDEQRIARGSAISPGSLAAVPSDLSTNASSMMSPSEVMHPGPIFEATLDIIVWRTT